MSAADGAGGYRWRASAFHAGADARRERLAPGEARAIGWLRTIGDAPPAFDLE